MRIDNLGVNLFSLRTLIKDEAGLTDTLYKLGEMGYGCAQYSGAPFDSERIARASRTSGLPITLTHVPFVDIIERPEWLMSEHAKFNCRNIGLGTLPRDMFGDKDRVYAAVEGLARSAEVMKKGGYTLYYHNHHSDCVRFDGEVLLDRMMRECADMSFTLDVYWLQYGGLSVSEYIEKLKGRIGCVHLKDYRIEIRDGENEPRFVPNFAPVGDGNMNFPDIIGRMREAGTEYYFVEQDNAVSYPLPLAEVKRSIDYLRRLM